MSMSSHVVALAIALVASILQSGSSVAPLTMPPADEGRCIAQTASGRARALHLRVVAWEVQRANYDARTVTVTTDSAGRLITYNELSSTMDSSNNPMVVTVVAGVEGDGKLAGVMMRMSRADSIRMQQVRQRLDSLERVTRTERSRQREEIDSGAVERLTSGLWTLLDSSQIRRVRAAADAVTKRCS